MAPPLYINHLAYGEFFFFNKKLFFLILEEAVRITQFGRGETQGGRNAIHKNVEGEWTKGVDHGGGVHGAPKT